MNRIAEQGCFDHESEFLDMFDRSVNALPANWRYAPHIESDLAARIYKRNFEQGLRINLQANFPVTAAYLGVDGFAFAARRFALEHRASKPAFTLYAAEFPGFLMSSEHNSVSLLLNVAGQLAVIDFFQGHVFEEGQSIEIDLAICRVWLSLRAHLDTSESIDPNGLYQVAAWHPQALGLVASRSRAQLRTRWLDGELVFQIHADRELI